MWGGVSDGWQIRSRLARLRRRVRAGGGAVGLRGGCPAVGASRGQGCVCARARDCVCGEVRCVYVCGMVGR
jgi:hypothetical protein